ncbi:MAG: polysaccharide deacetylase family protein [Candidatus Dojkabacteria bacterium]|nr:MAG: polysaccharide deacetylase family protein [Candidatus Dojkabacteria bacterium]
MSKSIILTFDVEEWFHTTFMYEYLTSRDIAQSRIYESLQTCLDLLNEHDIAATFFVLAELAEKNPKIINMITDANLRHEIASHSYSHDLLYEKKDSQIKKNIYNSKKILEDLSGKSVKGFRAPYFSINDHAIECLVNAGYKYDSSLHDFRLNGQYGTLTLPMKATDSPGIFTYKTLTEVTIPVKRYFNLLTLPFGGGGYYRLYPLVLQEYWIRSFLKTSDYFMMYLHPWEFDSNQPYITKAPFLKRFRHYVGIKSHKQKTDSLIRNLKSSNFKFKTLSEYLSNKKLTK